MDDMSTSKNKILIVDDEEVLSAIYKTRYEAEGFDVQYCSNGEDAVKAAKEFLPDLIMIDLMMPKLSGYDAIKEIRSTPVLKDVYIIVYSALTRPGENTSPEKIGANEFLVKSGASFDVVVDRVLKVMHDLNVNTSATDASSENV